MPALDIVPPALDTEATSPGALAECSASTWLYDCALHPRARRYAAFTGMTRRSYARQCGGTTCTRSRGRLFQTGREGVARGGSWTPHSSAPSPRTSARRSAQARWARSLFRDMFVNATNAAAVRTRALDDAAQMRPHLDRLVAERKAALVGGLHDVAIRHNFIGLITGWIPRLEVVGPRARRAAGPRLRL